MSVICIQRHIVGNVFASNVCKYFKVNVTFSCFFSFSFFQNVCYIAVVTWTRVDVLYSGEPGLQEGLVRQQSTSVQASRSTSSDVRRRQHRHRQTSPAWHAEPRRLRRSQLHRAGQLLRRDARLDGRPRQEDYSLRCHHCHVARKPQRYAYTPANSSTIFISAMQTKHTIST